MVSPVHDIDGAMHERETSITQYSLHSPVTFRIFDESDVRFDEKDVRFDESDVRFIRSRVYSTNRVKRVSDKQTYMAL